MNDGSLKLFPMVVFFPWCRILLILAVFLMPGPAAGKTIYVDRRATGDESGAGWVDACTSVSAGLTLAASGDEILVKSATYEEAVTLKEYVGLYGGFPADGSPTFEARNWSANPTVIDASELNTSVVTAAHRAVLDGFVLTRGRKVYGAGGGLIVIRCSPVIANCTITGNYATNSGGGVFANGSWGKMINCVITKNTCDEDGGGVMCYGGAPTFIGCRISENRTISDRYGAGGGMHLYASGADMIGCTVEGNTCKREGGGLYIYYQCDISLENCVIRSNVSGFRGGGVHCQQEDTVTLVNTIFLGNQSGSGGSGIHWRHSWVTMANCTFDGNHSLNGGGSAYSWQSTINIRNSVIWGNEAAGYEAEGGPISQISYSCIKGGFAGTGNTDLDPLFVSPWDGSEADVHLPAYSPCIDSGTSTDAPEADFDGNDRPRGGSWDMGAYEYCGDLTGDGKGDRSDFLFFPTEWHRPLNETNFRFNTFPDERIDDRDLVRLLWFWR